MSEWAGVINTTAPKYLKGAADLTFRKRLLLALLRKYGRIRTGESSYQCTWDVEFDQPPVRQFGDAGDQTFSRHDVYRQLTIDWRGYTTTDQMTKKEYLMNKGMQAIIDRYDRIIPNLVKSLTDTFGGEFFIDGYASGNTNRLHGLESFLGDGTTVAADLVAQPSDTYGTRSTALANHGGSWSTDLSTSPNAAVATDWPEGSGDVKYDFMSPKLVNYSSTSWGTSSTSWEDNCERALRKTTIWLHRTGGQEGRPTCYLLSSDLFADFQNFQAARNRIIIPHKESEDLGFSDALNFDGVAVKYDYNVPAGVGYGLNINQMELSSIDDVLFRPDGPEWDIKTKSWLFEVGFFGNLRYQPKYFSRLAAYA